MEGIVNRVANSGIITFNLEDYYHLGERGIYDVKNNLFQEIVLKEKDFRTFIKENDWSLYKGKNVAIICSVDAIIPTWAYMLLASALEPYCNKIVFGDLSNLEQALFQQALSMIDWNEYENTRVVIKGCGNKAIPTFAYVELTLLLKNKVKTLMYGEPCSTVPIFKKPK
jgi:hypothetical protein